MDGPTRTITSVARLFFAVAIIAFGIQHVVYGEFVTRVAPKLPASIPGHRYLAYLAGAVLLCAGAAMLFRKWAGIAGTVLGSLILLSFLVLYGPLLLASPPLGLVWTNAGKALALAGGAFLVAASLRRGSGFPDVMTTAATCFVSAFLIVAGIQHFLFTAFVATLVPGWIPGHVFWTYFAGVALIAGGIGMLVPATARLAALLSGAMILLWLVLLHIPRALAAPHDSNETTAVFEALAIGAAALLAASAGSSQYTTGE